MRDLLAAVDLDGQMARGEGHLTGVDELLQPVADDPERGVADADDVGRAEQLRAALGDRLAVDVGAVVRAEVADLHAPVGRRVELRVVAGDLQVRDDQVVLQGTADAHHAAERELVERGGAAVAVDRRRPPRHHRVPAAAGSAAPPAAAAASRAALRPAAARAAAGPAAPSRRSRPGPRTAAAAGPAVRRRRRTASRAARRSRCPGSAPCRRRTPGGGCAAPARTCRWCCRGPRSPNCGRCDGSWRDATTLWRRPARRRPVDRVPGCRPWTDRASRSVRLIPVRVPALHAPLSCPRISPSQGV